MIWSRTKYLLQYHLWQRKHQLPQLPIRGLRNLQPWKLLQQHQETIVTLRAKFKIFVKILLNISNNKKAQLSHSEFLFSKMKFFPYLRKFGPNWRQNNRRKRWQGLEKCRLRLKYGWSIHRVSWLVGPLKVVEIVRSLEVNSFLFAVSMLRARILEWSLMEPRISNKQYLLFASNRKSNDFQRGIQRRIFDKISESHRCGSRNILR